MNNKHFVSVIIITRNRHKYLEKCLEKVYKQEYEPFEVVVVDSSDSHESKEVVVQFSKTKYIYFEDGEDQRPESKNLGIENSRGDIVAFIDDDCEVHKDWLEEILRGYISEEVGGVGGGIKQDRAFLQFDSTGVGKISGLDVSTNWGCDLDRIVEVDHLPGGNMSFRREVIQKVGWFDQNYTGSNASEETDYSVRVRKCGYKLIFNPKACVDHHAASREFREHSLKGVFYRKRNKMYFFLKNYDCSLARVKRLLIHEIVDYWSFSSPNGGSENVIYFIYLMMINLMAMSMGILTGIGYKLRIINERVIKRNDLKRRIWKFIGSQFDKTLEVKPINKIYRLNCRIGEICHFASILSFQGKYDDAIIKLNEALSLNLSDKNLICLIYYTLGSTYEKMELFDKAKENFKIILELTADFKSIKKKRLLGGVHFHLGCIYQSLNDKEKAKEEFKICLEYIPEHRKAKEFLIQL